MIHFLFRLKTIHNSNYVHRDIHIENILLVKSYQKWKTGQWLIGDFGLSQPASQPANYANVIYGVIPYIAPEIFNRIAFSKASDVYAMGIVMWVLTTGCKPFSNIEYDLNLIYKIIEGERPEITYDTPECFANLMKKCWDPNPKMRPSIIEVCESYL